MGDSNRQDEGHLAYISGAGGQTGVSRPSDLGLGLVWIAASFPVTRAVVWLRLFVFQVCSLHTHLYVCQVLMLMSNESSEAGLEQASAGS